MNQSKQGSVLKIVQTLTAQGIEKLDANPNLIGIQDMVYEIDSTIPRSALAADLVFKSLGTTFDSDAQCPQWEQFLDTAMQSDQEMIRYLQRLVGYFLTASTKEQEIYYFYGSGANGKSTFLDLIKALLGTYGVKVTSDSFMKNRSGARSLGTMASLANLAGARLALTDETNDSDVAFDTQTLKSISGDDEITGRLLRHNPITFKSTAKVVMYGNDKPYGNINDEGFWRRFRFIHFGHVIPADQRDKDLLEKLKEELPGILNWALNGLKDWYKNGIQTPQKIIDEGIEYRKDLDSVTDFLRRNTSIAEADHFTPSIQLYERYNIWCRDNLTAPESKQAFSKRASLYFEKTDGVKSHRTNCARGFKGVRLS
jgi:putative DNA primase/helicase